MNPTKIKNLIKVWYGKSQRENDPFSKFVFLWICFNAWLDFRSGKVTDAEMIDWLVSQSKESSDLVRKFEDSKTKNTFVESLKILAVMSPFEDSRGKRDPIVITDENDFENIVRAIYRIRCNLFHGGSGAHEDGVLKEVVVSNEILKNWMGGIISEW